MEKSTQVDWDIPAQESRNQIIPLCGIINLGRPEAGNRYVLVWKEKGLMAFQKILNGFVQKAHFFSHFGKGTRS